MTSIPNLTVITVRNLVAELQKCRNKMSDFISERACRSPLDSRRNGSGRTPYVIEEEQIRFFKRNVLFMEKNIRFAWGKWEYPQKDESNVWHN